MDLGEVSSVSSQKKERREKEAAKSATDLMERLRKQAKKAKTVSNTNAHELIEDLELVKRKRPTLLKVDGKLKEISQKYKELSSHHKNNIKKNPSEYKEVPGLILEELENAQNLISECMNLFQELQKGLKDKVNVFEALTHQLNTIDESARNFYQEVTIQLSELDSKKPSEEPFKFRNLATEEEKVLLDANRKTSVQDTNFLRVTTFAINSDIDKIGKPKKKKQQKKKAK